MTLAIKEKPITLLSLAKEYLNKYNGNTELAIEDLMNAISGDRYLLRAITEDAVKEAVRSFVSLHHRVERSSIISGHKLKVVSENRVDVSGASKRLIEFHKRLLLDFPLKGGIKLRNANRIQVLNQAERYAKTEKNAAINHRWLMSIANCLQNDTQKVGEVITEAKAKELREAA